MWILVKHTGHLVNLAHVSMIQVDETDWGKGGYRVMAVFADGGHISLTENGLTKAEAEAKLSDFYQRV